jgi:hypothetical protein
MATAQQTHVHSQSHASTTTASDSTSGILEFDQVKRLYWSELGKLCDWYFPEMARLSGWSIKTIYNLSKQYGVGHDDVENTTSARFTSPEYTDQPDDISHLDPVEREYLSKPRW